MNQHDRAGNRMIASVIHILMELAAIYPLLVLLDAYLLQTDMPWSWVMLLLGFAGIGTLLRPAVRLYALTNGTLIVLFAILTGIACYSISTAPSTIITWIAVALFGVLALLRGIAIARSDWDRIFPIRWQLIALALTWIIYIVAGNSNSIHDVRGSLYIAGAFTLFALLFRFAAQQIDYISLDEGFSFASLRAVIQRTRRWTWLVIVLIVILGASDQITSWLEQAWSALIAWLSPSAAPPPTILTNMSNPPPMEAMPLPEPNETTMMNPFWIEKAAQLITILAVATVISLVGVVIVRLLRRYAPKLYRWLLSLWEPQSLEEDKETVDAYTDEIERLQETPKPARRFLQRNRKPAEVDERVRYYYRQLISRADKKGITLAASATPERVGRQLAPQEYAESTQDTSTFTTGNLSSLHGSRGNSPDSAGIRELINLYNRVRYEGQPVDEPELAQWEQKYDRGGKKP